MPVSSSTEHWIKPDALTINLNHFGDPDYLQVSVLAGAVVMAFKQDVIGYNAAHNYRTWPLDAANTYLETTSAVNVYAKLTRSEVNARALIAYDTVLRDIEGREITYAEDGSEILGEPSPDLYYVFLGQISASVNSNGESVQREWSSLLKFGSLQTNQQQNDLYGGFERMFRPHYDDPLNPDKITWIEALAHLGVIGGITLYVDGGNIDLPSLYAGIPVDGTTITKREDGTLMLNPNLELGGLDEEALQKYLDDYNYAKLSDIPSLDGYAKLSDIPSLDGYAKITDVDSRINDLVNGAPAAYDTLKEIADVLQGNVNSIGDIITTLGTKADKTYVDDTFATKSSLNATNAEVAKKWTQDNDKIANWDTAYGWGDHANAGYFLASNFTKANIVAKLSINDWALAATKPSYTTKEVTEDTNLYFTNKRAIDALAGTLKAYVTLKGTQTIEGEKNFTGGLKVNGSPIIYNSEKGYWLLQGNLLITGGLTMYADDGSVDLPNLYDGLPIDNQTIYWENGVLKAVGGGGVADSVAWADITGKPSFATIATSGSYNDLLNKPTLLSSFTNDLGFVTESALSGKYVPLAGGVTMTGFLNITTGGTVFSVRQTNGGTSYINFRSVVNGTSKDLGDFGVDVKQNLVYYNSGAWRNVIHSGNYTSYTYSQSTIDSKLSGYLPLSGGTLTGKLTINTSSYGGQLEIYRNQDNGNSAIRFSNSEKVLGDIGVCGSGGEYPYQPYFTDRTTNIMSKIYHSGNLTKLSQLTNDSGFITSSASISGNAATATKLATARTIWGQSFDGSGNVSGALSGVGNITTNNSNADIYLQQSTDSRSWWTGIGISSGDDKYVIYDATAKQHRLSIDTSGNVGIGTTNPAYRLDVDGNLRVNSNIYGCLAVRDANGNWIVGKSDSDNGEVSLGSINKTQAVTLRNSAGSIYLNSSGDVGIGTTSPEYKLHVAGAVRATYFETGNSSYNDGTIELYGGTPFIDFHYGRSTADFTNRLIEGLSGQLTCTGKFRIGLNYTTSTDYKFYVSGSAYISSNLLTGGGITMYSQRSLKNVIDEDGLSLRELSIIKPTRYTWKDKRDERLHIGGIADDIQQVLPEVVYRTPDGVLTMDYGNAAFAIASSLIKPMIEHESEIVSLKRRVRELEEEVKRLRA